MSRLRAWLGRLALSMLRIAARLLPRDRRLLAVGGGKGLRFADNSMHFFQQCSEHRGLRTVWLTRSPRIVTEVRAAGRRAHLVASPAGLWYGLRAALHVFDVGPSDTGPTSRFRDRLNLWHGVPLKDISFLRPGAVRRAAAMRGSDWLLHTCRNEADKMLRAFPVDPERLIIANLPRNAALAGAPRGDAGKPSDRALLAALRARRGDRRIVGYFPTWRTDDRDRFLGCRDAAELAAVLERLDALRLLLVTKWHACSYAEYRHAGRSSIVEGIAGLIAGSPQVVALPFTADLNTFLPGCAALVTDYSSVFFDYLWCDRPIVFNPYDLEEYRSQFGFYYDYARFVPGPIAREPASVIDALADVLAPGGDRHAAARRSMRARFFEAAAGTDLILRRLGLA